MFLSLLMNYVLAMSGALGRPGARPAQFYHGMSQPAYKDSRHFSAVVEAMSEA